MKKILFSISTLAFVGMLVAGGTYAAWSAQETVSGNTVGAATVELALAGSENSQTVEKPIVAEGLLPGDYSDWFHVGVKNTSSVDGRVYMYVNGLQGNGGVCQATNLEVQVKCDLPGTCDSLNEPWAAFSGGLHDILGEENRIELTGDVDGSGQSPFDPALFGDPDNWTLVVEQRAQLDENASENVQGETCQWNEVFVLEPENE